MSECQRKTKDKPKESEDLAQAAKDCSCVPGAKTRRDMFLDIRSSKAPTCPAPAQPAPPPPNPVVPAPACETTYKCDFNVSPQVCANAASAIRERAKPTMFAMLPNQGSHDTAVMREEKEGTSNALGIWSEDSKNQWYRDHIKGVAKGAPVPHLPKDGWGLAHCNVEEYPFAAFRPRSDHNPVLVKSGVQTAQDRRLCSHPSYPIFTDGPPLASVEDKMGGKISREMPICSTSSYPCLRRLLIITASRLRQIFKGDNDAGGKHWAKFLENWAKAKKERVRVLKARQPICKSLVAETVHKNCVLTIAQCVLISTTSLLT
jgi:hypothetical protein